MLNGKKVIAFICECNPFHEGHKRLIRLAKKEGDIVIAIMSGDYVQRGEPAVESKYNRTKKLLKNGVNLVIELPLIYSLSSAKLFAKSSINILNKLKFVDKLIFGSKINNIDKLNAYAKINIDDVNIKEYLKSGLSYPKAISKIYGKNLSANDILAVEYIRSIYNTKSKIEPISIKRENDLPTASELRKHMTKKITNDSFSEILNFKLLMAKNNLIDLSNTYCMTDDLYNAILNNYKHTSFEKLAKSLNTKNRTLANIKRILLNIVLSITKDVIKGDKVNYIRILGFDKSFVNYLKDIKVPYLLNYTPSSYKSYIKNYPKSKEIKQNKNGGFILSPSIKFNIFATALYNAISKNKLNEQTMKVLKT